MSQKYENDSLGTRMKRYESVTKTHLMRRTPTIIRIDGRAFHTFTKRLKRIDPSLKDTPYSLIMHDCMMSTTNALVDGIQGCVLGYTQSDEISLLLRDWDTLETQPWFDGSVQKIASVSAAIATAAFNFAYGKYEIPLDFSDLAQFDSRVHNIPVEEVVNYFIWRQQDASRNSIQMFGHHYFSQREMHGLTNSEVQDKLMLEKGINWNDVAIWMKRGSCLDRSTSGGHTMFVRDDEIPIFTQDREYISRVLTVDNR